MFFKKLRMRITLVLIPLFVFVNALISKTTAGPAVNFERSAYDFSVDLYDHVKEGQDSNIIMSPLSVQMSIGLALMGARGQTEQEMINGLKLTGGQRNTISDGFKNILEPYKNNPMLKIANKLYVMQNYHIRPEFNEIATTKFNSETESVNFARAENAAENINHWVEEKTNNLIKDLISPDVLSSDTRMVLVNAIHFKGVWKYPFPKHATVKAPFYTSDTESTDVDMMHVKETFRYGEFDDLDAKAIELPYKDSDMSMFIILPNKRNGLSELETKMKTTTLNDLSKRMYRMEVEVSIPKFKIEFEVKLPEVLKKMGMTTMFSNSADFSGLLEENEPIKISEVIHKAFIDVNEEGAEAAAATGAVMMLLSLRPTMHFHAKHPFLFFIASSSKPNEAYFIGNYANKQ